MNERTIGNARSNTGKAFVWAAALFAMMCGGILAAFGDADTGTVVEETQESIQSVITELDAAATSLEDKDYGRARAHLRSARTGLSRLDE